MGSHNFSSNQEQLSFSNEIDLKLFLPPTRLTNTSPLALSGMIFLNSRVPRAKHRPAPRVRCAHVPAQIPIMPTQQTAWQEAKIDTLPDNILADIFSVLTVSSNESRLYDPTTLSHVSSRWRAVALSASSLWTFIVVTFPLAAGQIARAKAALARSKDRPIDVHIDIRDPDWSWESDEDQHQMRSVSVVEIMEWLGPSHPRWRSLTVLTDTWVPMHTFLAYSTMFSSLPKLERLSLNRCNAFAGLPDAPDPVPSDPVGLFDGNAHLPKLRHVALAGVHINYSCTGFKGLLSLDLRHQPHKVSPTTRQLRQLFHASPGLKTLSLVALNPHTEEPEQDDGPAVSLTNLTDLTLGWWFVEDVVELLKVLRLPVVENLVLEDIAPTLLQQDFVARDSTPILDILERMGSVPPDPALPPSFPSQLRRLTINGVLLNPTAFSRFIPLLANLEELELKSVQPDLVQAVDHAQRTAESDSSVVSVILKLR